MLPLLGFIFISLLVVAAGMAFSTSAGTIERRLEEVAGVMVKPVDEERAFDKKVAGALKRLGNAVPRSPSEMGKLQQRLVSAGYRRNEAVAIFLGIRVGFALLLFGMFASPLVFRPNFLSAIAAAGIGYVLPGFLLARMAKRRMHRFGWACQTRLTCWWSASKPASVSTRQFSASPMNWRSLIPNSPTRCA
jgi:hypothetical protein